MSVVMNSASPSGGCSEPSLSTFWTELTFWKWIPVRTVQKRPNTHGGCVSAKAVCDVGLPGTEKPQSLLVLAFGCYLVCFVRDLFEPGVDVHRKVGPRAHDIVPDGQIRHVICQRDDVRHGLHRGVAPAVFVKHFPQVLHVPQHDVEFSARVGVQ